MRKALPVDDLGRNFVQGLASCIEYLRIDLHAAGIDHRAKAGMFPVGDGKNSGFVVFERHFGQRIERPDGHQRLTHPVAQPLGAMPVSRKSSSTNTPTLRAWSRPSSLSRSESSSPSFAIPTEQTSVPVSIHRIKLISSINSNSIVQNTQVLQRPGNAVVVDRSGHVVGGVQRLVAGIAHGNPHPRGRQHRHVVAAVAEGRDLRSP